jgi:hypothetical protein
MKYSIYLFGLISIMCASCNKRIAFPKSVEQNIDLKYYDDDKGKFYLLTFYKKLEASSNEDFIFSGMTTYKDNADEIIDVDSTQGVVRQYIALYFFKGGGVVYHYPYSFKLVNHSYGYLNIGDFNHYKDQYLKNPKKFKSIMIGSLNSKDTKLRYIPTTVNSTKDNISKYELEESKIAKTFTDAKQIQAELSNQPSSRPRNVKKDTIPITINLFSGKYIKSKQEEDSNIRAKKQILMICDYINRKDSAMKAYNAIEIKGLSYRTGVSTSGTSVMQASVNRTFDLGDTTSKRVKPSLYFRLTDRESEIVKNNLKK